MGKFFPPFGMLTIKKILTTSSMLTAYTLWGVSKVFADFGGPIPNIPGTPGATDEAGIRDKVTDLLIIVLNFLALVAVIFLVIAGIRLITSQVEEDAKNKAKKTILYVLAGLLLILFARVIVGFIAHLFT